MDYLTAYVTMPEWQPFVSMRCSEESKHCQMGYKACTLSRPGAFAPSLYLRAAEVQVPGQSKRTPTLQVPPSAPPDNH